MLSKQQLNTSYKQCVWHEILSYNMCKITKLLSCLRTNFCFSSSEFGPRGQFHRAAQAALNLAPGYYLAKSFIKHCSRPFHGKIEKFKKSHFEKSKYRDELFCHKHKERLQYHILYSHPYIVCL